MTKKKPIAIASFIAALTLATLAQPALADDQKGETAQAPTVSATNPSFFQRYTQSAQELVIKGLQFVGVRYRWGGNDPETGLDCSGFVRHVFQESLGLMLPRSAKDMSKVGENVDNAELRPGDLVFFNTMRRTFSHVGIYLGNNQFLHAPRAGAEVRVEDIRQNYWVSRYNGARRILERNPG